MTSDPDPDMAFLEREADEHNNFFASQAEVGSPRDEGVIDRGWRMTEQELELEERVHQLEVALLDAIAQRDAAQAEIRRLNQQMEKLEDEVERLAALVMEEES